MKLEGTYPWQFFPDFQYLSKDDIIPEALSLEPFLMIIICMAGFAKQSAQGTYPHFGIVLFHLDDCLAPGFFLISILSISSATSIKVLRALFCIWDSVRAFLRALTSSLSFSADFFCGMTGGLVVLISTFSLSKLVFHCLTNEESLMPQAIAACAEVMPDSKA